MSAKLPERAWPSNQKVHVHPPSLPTTQLTLWLKQALHRAHGGGGKDYVSREATSVFLTCCAAATHWWAQGTLGGSSVQVEVFGCNLAMSLDSSKVSSFFEGRDGRLAKLGAASNLGRKVG